MAKGLILWSTEEERWVVNPCLCCTSSMQRFNELYCYELDAEMPKDGFCHLWVRRKETRDEDN